MSNTTETTKKAPEISLIEPQGENSKFSTLVVQGTEYKTLVTYKYKNRKKWEQANEKEVLSVIPGTIKKLYVKAGDTVKKDQELLIIEAMKMENTIFAPYDAKIKSINIKLEDRIPKGVVILEFE